MICLYNGVTFKALCSLAQPLHIKGNEMLCSKAPQKQLREDSLLLSSLPQTDNGFGNILTFRLTLTLYTADSTLQALIGTVT